MQTAGRVEGGVGLVGVADGAGGDRVVPVGGAAGVAAEADARAGAGVVVGVPRDGVDAVVGEGGAGDGHGRLVLGRLRLAGDLRQVVGAADAVDMGGAGRQRAVAVAANLAP